MVAVFAPSSSTVWTSSTGITETQSGQWNRVRITNNVIVNNVAGWSGAGVSLQDTARSFIIEQHDRSQRQHGDGRRHVRQPEPVANQPAGISSEVHSAGLNAAIPVRNNTADIREFSNPTLAGNILWENRSFHYDAVDGTSKLEPVLDQTLVGQCVAGATFWNLDPRLVER